MPDPYSRSRTTLKFGIETSILAIFNCVYKSNVTTFFKNIFCFGLWQSLNKIQKIFPENWFTTRTYNILKTEFYKKNISCPKYVVFCANSRVIVRPTKMKKLSKFFLCDQQELENNCLKNLGFFCSPQKITIFWNLQVSKIYQWKNSTKNKKLGCTEQPPAFYVFLS